MVDYTKDCLTGQPCAGANDCCPSPLPHSHLVFSYCWCRYIPPIGSFCQVGVGQCEYRCDAGYEWDGEACVECSGHVAKRKLLGVGS